MKTLLVFLVCMNLANQAISQTTITLQPGALAGKDAEIFDLDEDLNRSDVDVLRGNAWTFSGSEGIVRGFLEFDLTQIPAGSTIQSAHLSLYGLENSHSQVHAGENAAYLRRVEEYWGETEVTWGIQPSSTTSNQVAIPASSGGSDDYENIDVTSMVQDMFEEPANSFGFMIRLQVEDPLRRLSFASSDHNDSERHPKLVIEYTQPTCTTIVLQPGTEGKDAEVFSLEPDNTYDFQYVRGNAWTFSGDLGVSRGFFAFDLSQIPSTATIENAWLTLYPPTSPDDQFNSGDNSGLLQRVTSSWNESDVTWVNQPDVTPVNSVALPASHLAYQEYRSMDVTEMVQDMIENPAESHGFRLSLDNETTFRRLTFASSDHEDASRHPRLEVCVTGLVNTPVITDESLVKFVPSLVTDNTTLQATSVDDQYLITITDNSGKIVDQVNASHGSMIFMNAYSPGLYFFRTENLSSGVISLSKITKQ